MVKTSLGFVILGLYRSGKKIFRKKKGYDILRRFTKIGYFVILSGFGKKYYTQFL